MQLAFLASLLCSDDAEARRRRRRGGGARRNNGFAFRNQNDINRLLRIIGQRNLAFGQIFNNGLGIFDPRFIANGSHAGGLPSQDCFGNLCFDPRRPTAPVSPTAAPVGTPAVAQQQGDPNRPADVAKLGVPVLPVVAGELEFCSNPYKAICEAAQKTPPPRGLRASLANQALAGKDITDTNSPSFVSDATNFVSSLQRISQVRNPQVILNQVRDALRREISNDPAYAPFRGQMLARLDNVTIRPYADIATRNSGELAQFLGTCGQDGLSFNAVFSSRPGQIGGEILVCPAYLSALATDEQAFRVLGHELGHAIDFNKVRGAHTAHIACLTKNHPGFSSQLGGESTADVCSCGAVINKLLAERAGPDAILSFAGSSFRGYCDKSADGPAFQLRGRVIDGVNASNGARPIVHPPTDFRVAVLFGMDPRVRRAMGCSVAQGERKECSSRGEVTF